jgi:hypothetical protein
MVKALVFEEVPGEENLPKAEYKMLYTFFDTATTLSSENSV